MPPVNVRGEELIDSLHCGQSTLDTVRVPDPSLKILQPIVDNHYDLLDLHVNITSSRMLILKPFGQQKASRTKG